MKDPGVLKADYGGKAVKAGEERRQAYQEHAEVSGSSFFHSLWSPSNEDLNTETPGSRATET